MKKYICPCCCRIMSEDELTLQKEKGLFPGMPDIVQTIVKLFFRIFGMLCVNCMAHNPEPNDMILFDQENEDISKIRVPSIFKFGPNKEGVYCLKYQQREFGMLLFGILFTIAGCVATVVGGPVGLIFLAIGLVLDYFGFMAAFAAARIRFYDDHLDVSYGLGEGSKFMTFHRSKSTGAQAIQTHTETRKGAFGTTRTKVKYKVVVSGEEGQYKIGRSMDSGPSQYLEMLINWYFSKAK